jgi:hypothetical protein
MTNPISFKFRSVKELREQFQNQGQCMREANINPSSGVTKEDCKAAFKA